MYPDIAVLLRAAIKAAPPEPVYTLRLTADEVEALVNAVLTTQQLDTTGRTDALLLMNIAQKIVSAAHETLIGGTSG